MAPAVERFTQLSSTPSTRSPVLIAPEPPPNWSALVLSGGRGSRLGADKDAVLIGGASSMNHVLVSLPTAIHVVVVGPEPREPVRPVTVTRESPIGGGPAAAIAAGLEFVTSDIVAVIATDMPFAGTLLARLVQELPAGLDALMPIDTHGRRQPLCAVYRTAALRAAIASLGDPNGQSMRALTAHLAVREILIEDHTTLHDIDTTVDLDRARAIMLSMKGDW